MDDRFRRLGIGRNLARDTEIYGEGEPADTIYMVISGGARTVKLTLRGDRQITEFYLPGEIFGLEVGETHRCSAEATDDSEVLTLRRNVVIRDLSYHPQLFEQLWAQTAAQLQRAEVHILLLGRQTAEERLATFLRDMSKRLSAGESFELPMSRRDIADYLSLTIETVSRVMTHLRQERIIAMPTTRRIVILDPLALARASDRATLEQCHCYPPLTSGSSMASALSG
jgi:CRP/FNR family nitrogen fixation transcriptional regulator